MLQHNEQIGKDRLKTNPPNFKDLLQCTLPIQSSDVH